MRGEVRPDTINLGGAPPLSRIAAHPRLAIFLLRRRSRRLGQFALLFLTPEDNPQEVQRVEVSVDQREHAVLVPASDRFAIQLTQLALVDHLEALINIGFARLTVPLDADFAFHKEAVLDQFVGHQLGAVTCLFELFAEVEDRLGVLGGRVVLIEQGVALAEIAHGIAGGIEAQGKILVLGPA